MTKIFHLNQNNYDIPQFWGGGGIKKKNTQYQNNRIQIYNIIYSVLKCHTM